jgi:hypothetical protein
MKVKAGELTSGDALISVLLVLVFTAMIVLMFVLAFQPSSGDKESTKASTRPIDPFKEKCLYGYEKYLTFIGKSKIMFRYKDGKTDMFNYVVERKNNKIIAHTDSTEIPEIYYDVKKQEYSYENTLFVSC